MLRTHFALWLTLPTAVLSSCAQTERVQVGILGTSVDFGTCLGDDTRCEQGFPPAREVEPEDGVTQCERVEDDGWNVAWWRKFNRIPCAPVGYCDAHRMSVSGDGTVWTASLGESPIVDSDETLFGLFLVHYDQDGEPIAQEVVETRELRSDDNAIQMAIAADARGHVFVAMMWTEDEAWLREFDAAARPVGQLVRLEGWPRKLILGLSMAPDGSVFLSARSGLPRSTPSELNAVAKLDSNLRPVWLQTRALPPHGFYALLTGGPQVTLVGDADTGPGPWGVSQVGTLDSTGNLVDLMHVPFTEAPFAVDRRGNLFAIALGIGSPSIATKLTPRGEVLFQVEVPSVMDPNDFEVVHQLVAAVDPEGNSFYAMHWDGLAMTGDQSWEYRETLTLWQLDPDGERCRVSNVVDALGGIENAMKLNEMDALFAADNGDLYVVTDNGIARLTR